MVCPSFSIQVFQRARHFRPTSLVAQKMRDLVGGRRVRQGDSIDAERGSPSSLSIVPNSGDDRKADAARPNVAIEPMSEVDFFVCSGLSQNPILNQVNVDGAAKRIRNRGRRL